MDGSRNKRAQHLSFLDLLGPIILRPPLQCTKMKLQIGAITALLSIVPVALGSVFAPPLRRDTTDICANVDAGLDILGIEIGLLGRNEFMKCRLYVYLQVLQISAFVWTTFPNC